MIDSATETRYYRENALDALDIGKTTFYKWIEYLEIEQSTDEQRRKYLNQEQVDRLLELKKYHQENATIEGFRGTPESSGIVKSENSSLSSTENNIYVEPDEPTANMDVDRLVRSAQELAARNMAMGDLLKLSLAQGMTFDDLDPDLQEKVNAAQEVANPKDTPASIASSLLAQYRSGK